MQSRVFISYSSANATVAGRVCEALESAGAPCWMAPRDIEPGSDYTDALNAAIESARAVVLIFSRAANKSRHVRSEIRAAFDRSKTIVPLRIEDTVPKGGMDHLLGNAHWLAVDADDRGDFDNRIGSVLKLLDVETDTYVPRRQMSMRARALGCSASVAVALSVVLGAAAFFLVVKPKSDMTVAELTSARSELAEAKKALETKEDALLQMKDNIALMKEERDMRSAQLSVVQAELRRAQQLAQKLKVESDVQLGTKIE